MNKYHYRWRKCHLTRPLIVGGEILPIGTEIELACKDSPPEYDIYDEEDGYFYYLYCWKDCIGSISENNFDINEFAHK